jgi:spectinomycin phosphotransferase
VLEDPGLDLSVLTAALRTAWAVDASAFTFVPGYDMRAVSYAVSVAKGDDRFLKVRLEPSANDAPLAVPRALLDAGIPGILAPIPTLTGELTHALLDGRTLVLYPYVAGRNAMVAGMTRDQWRAFGTTLRAVHASGLEERFAGSLPAETFRLASAALVRQALEQARRDVWPSPAQTRLAALLRDEATTIEAMLTRATALGETLCGRAFDHVLCHADIHAANILVADDGRIVLVDWDGPMLAPRERDLLFVIGSRIARTVTPQEESWFFDGYGAAPLDPDAIVYYRYERILQDIGEIGRSVFDGDIPETSRATQVALAASWFEPGGDIEAAEAVDIRLAVSGGRWDNGRPPKT